MGDLAEELGDGGGGREGKEGDEAVVFAGRGAEDLDRGGREVCQRGVRREQGRETGAVGTDIAVAIAILILVRVVVRMRELWETAGLAGKSRTWIDDARVLVRPLGAVNNGFF